MVNDSSKQHWVGQLKANNIYHLLSVYYVLDPLLSASPMSLNNLHSNSVRYVPLPILF